MKIIAYTYEADAHCVDCAKLRHSLQPFPSAGIHRRDEHGLPEDGADNEGNPVHPVFSTDEQLESLHCGDCLEEIVHVKKPAVLQAGPL